MTCDHNNIEPFNGDKKNNNKSIIFFATINKLMMIRTLLLNFIIGVSFILYQSNHAITRCQNCRRLVDKNKIDSNMF